MATKLRWFKDRPFLLWLGTWSLYFEGMHLLWGTKGPNPFFFNFHLMPALWSLLYCVRPSIACVLRVVYGLGIVAGIVLPFRTSLDFDWGRAIGGSCMSALFVDLMVTLAKQQSAKTD